MTTELSPTAFLDINFSDSPFQAFDSGELVEPIESIEIEPIEAIEPIQPSDVSIPEVDQDGCLYRDLIPLSVLLVNKKLVRLISGKSTIETILLIDGAGTLYEVIRLFVAPVPNQIRIIRYSLLSSVRMYGLKTEYVVLDVVHLSDMWEPPATKEWLTPWDKLGCYFPFQVSLESVDIIEAR
jgi:hypothetical protein